RPLARGRRSPAAPGRLGDHRLLTAVPDSQLRFSYPAAAMVQTCSRCTRVNPPEALYCYFDGAALDGHGARGGPVNVGSQPFSVPFVFPTGRACRNFDQLALACQEDGTAAQNALQQGDLAIFLGSAGR